ncbi:MarR family transcriptional regulator [Lysinibacillus cavernae]|uniref:MarR family transcriptional regulator n=1 Tax=Lysinibacillus cavernae TaxID=2666135 RepID=UPI001E4928D6|nr:MarR family transcriptional regulator [Lysinibacillus cavernae]
MQTIAILGSLFFWNNIKQHFTMFPKAQFIHFPYTSPKQCVDLIDEAASCSDIVLFAGSIPYFYCYEKIQASQIQATYIPFDELTLTLSLLSLQHNERVELPQLSIDVPRKDSFYQVMKEAGISSTDVYVMDYAWVYEQPEKIAELNISDYVRYHKELFETGKTSLALTSLHAVYIELQKLGVPAKYMVESKQTFTMTINTALDAYKHTLLSASQIAVVSICSKQNLLVNHQAFLHNLEKICKRFQARVTQSQQEPYVIISTRGVIEKLEPNYLSSIIEQCERQFETFFTIGIGYGYSLHEAEVHSSQALFFTSKWKDSSTVMCLVDADNRLHGPLFENNKEISLSSNNKEILEIAEKVKMSAKNLNVMKQFISVTNNRPFSAAELAQYMNLSRRSAERIIIRLIEQDYFMLAGEEQPYLQGRPRKLYKATTKWTF